MENRTTAGAGYSGTPLPKKLGLKEGFRIALPGAPPGFLKWLGALPAGTRVVRSGAGPLDLVVLFARKRADLEAAFDGWAARLTPAGMLWAAWPKKAAKIQTDVGESVVRAIGLGSGLVDNKVCAIDETWSGLRFVRRLKDR